MLRVLFMGTPDFAEESLKQIDEAGHEIVGVVTNIDKPKGRGMKLIYSPVKEYAIKRNFKIFQPLKVKNNPEFIEQIRKLNPEVICVVAYGKILPKELLQIPKYGAINVHGSLLPKYRGAAPIQWSIINGDKLTGVTTMYMDEGMDTGDIILKKEVRIDDDETTGQLWEKLASYGGKLLVDTLELIKQGKATRQKQGDSYTLAPMLDKKMAKIDWENQTSEQIKNLVRGLNPIMGAYSLLEGKKIKFWKVDIINDEQIYTLFPELKEYSYRLKDIVPGTVLFSDNKKGLFVKTKDGIIKIIELQAENSKKMNALDFLRGNNINVGTIFS